MCGIAGFFGASLPGDPAEHLASMEGALAHRGPDGAAAWISEDRRTGLAHTRLAIIDLEGGAQPMATADGRYVVVFNGEIYNHEALHADLERLGHSFRTRSDTEVLLEAYRRWGPGCLERFHGMFALALLDRREQSILLARDPTGIKPLYFAEHGDGLLFASEPKALLGLPFIPRRLDYRSLVDFLVLGYPLPPRTIYRDLHELGAGSWLLRSSRGVERGSYWRWERREESWNEEEALERSEEALVESLRDHLVSDVPLGAFLSGGIDSSLLVALLRRRLHVEIDTFNVAFPDAAFDESEAARLVSRHLGTRHHELRLAEGERDSRLVERVLEHFDQPFGDSSAIPTFLISARIREHVKVALSGDGGDEMFGGYPRFWYADAARRLGSVPGLAPVLGSALASALGSLRPEFGRRLGRLLRAAEGQGGDRLLELACIMPPEELDRVLAPGARTRCGDYRPRFPRAELEAPPGRADGAELVDATILAELPGDYLRKVDVASSAHGLEVRVPFLGRQVLSLAARLPHRLRYSRRVNKRLLRRLAARHLPQEIVEKPKAGFSIPLDRWLGDEGRRDLARRLGDPGARLRALVSGSYLREVLRAFETQDWDRRRYSRYMLYQRVYLLWGLETWLRRWDPGL